MSLIGAQSGLWCWGVGEGGAGAAQAVRQVFSGLDGLHGRKDGLTVLAGCQEDGRHQGSLQGGQHEPAGGP